MRKKIRFKSLLSSALFTLGCLAAAVYFINLFWRDLNAYTARSDKQAVATVTFKNRVAQRKFDDRVVWERISQNAPLYDGDTISTADGAEATLHFEDGTKLDLYENTMVKLALTEDGGLDLNVSGGDIQVDTKEATGAAKVSVSLGDGSKVALQKGSVVSVARGAGAEGKASVAVQDGSATVTGASGESAAIASGEAVSVAKGGAVEKRSLSVLYPPKELRLFAQADDTVGLEVRVSWKSGGGSANGTSRAGGAGASSAVIVQTSETRDFSLIASESVVTDGDSATILVKQSPLYWRVIGAGANMPNTAAGVDTASGVAVAENAVAASGRITVERLSRVALTSPAAETVFRYKSEVPAVTLRWSEIPFAERYTLTVSQNADVSNPVLSQSLSVPFAEFTPTGAGVYYWRVEPILSREVDFPLESAVGRFSLEQMTEIAQVGVVAPIIAEIAAGADSAENSAESAETAESAEAAQSAEEAQAPAVEEPPAPPPPPPPPKPAELTRPYLLSPKYNLVMGNTYLKNNRTIYFSWQRVQGAASYSFTLTKVAGRRRTTVLSRTLTKPNITLSDLSILSEGNFEWSVVANPVARSTTSLPSRAATSVFSIRLTAPGKVDAEAPEGVYGN